MSGNRIAALAKRVILQFRRDRRTMALLVIVPLAVLSLLAYLIEIEPGDIPLGIVNQDEGAFVAPVGHISAASQVIQELRASPAFQVVELSREEVDSRIRSGRIKAALLFPPDFTRELVAQRRVKVELPLEGSNPQTSAAVVQHLRDSFIKAALTGTGSSGGETAPSSEAPFAFHTRYIYGGEQFDTLDYFAPVLIGFFPYLFVFLLTSVSFLRERAQGTMERLAASPLTKAEVVLGYMLGFSVFALLQSSLILLFSVYVLRIHFSGNLLHVFVVVIVLTIGAVNLGIFLSTFARNELQAVQFMPLVFLPQVLLSGVFWAIEDMHPVLQWLAHALPLTYANFALRDVMLKGHGLAESSVAASVLILTAFAAGMVLLGALTLRREVA